MQRSVVTKRSLPEATKFASMSSHFKELEQTSAAAQADDVYANGYVPKKYDKKSAEYGTPKPGTLTAMRAEKASKHVAREMLYLCEIINQYGTRIEATGQVAITFGELFNIYQYISDKVVGMLLRARKHNMVAFEGEMLFQRRDDAVVITLLLSTAQLKEAANKS